MSVTLNSILDKIIPTLILVVIMAMFGMYMRIGYLEQTAKLSIERYVSDMEELKADIKELKDKTTLNREDVIRLKARKE